MERSKSVTVVNHISFMFLTYLRHGYDIFTGGFGYAKVNKEMNKRL